MDIIEKMLTGQIEMREFIALLNNTHELQYAIKTLVPKEAIDNETNTLWERISFETLKNFDFDLLALLSKRFRFDDSIPDNLNIFGTISTVYCFTHPYVVCTKKYEEKYDLYLDAVRDCFDGPEVRHLILDIIEKSLTLSTKKKRLEQAKTEIKKLFHIINLRRPRWVSGPEWPMGEQSPMCFVCQKHYKDFEQYQFKDFDNGKIRIIEQYY